MLPPHCVTPRKQTLLPPLSIHPLISTHFPPHPTIPPQLNPQPSIPNPQPHIPAPNPQPPQPQPPTPNPAPRPPQCGSGGRHGGVEAGRSGLPDMDLLLQAPDAGAFGGWGCWVVAGCLWLVACGCLLVAGCLWLVACGVLEHTLVFELYCIDRRVKGEN